VRLSALGGKAQYRWSLAVGSTLPAGFTLDGATGTLAGVPTVAGSFPLEVTVTDALGFTDTIDVTLRIAAKLALAKRALTLHTGRTFRFRLLPTGGIGPVTWRLARGKLPAGVHFAKGTGELAGTPRRAGRASIDVEVTDALGGVARATLLLKVQR
jgi:hypothetical protein